MAVRKTERREERLASEFMVQFFANRHVGEQVALGPPPQEMVDQYGLEMASRMGRVWREKIDRVVYPPPDLILVEAKIWKIDDGIAKLRMYGDDIPYTPEFAKFLNVPRRLVLVVPWITDKLRAKAERHGIEAIVFCPSWIEDVVRQQHEYWTSAYRLRREDTLRTREKLGLE